MILTVEMLNEPGVRHTTLEPILCFLILCRYENIDEENIRRTMWELYIPEDY